MAKKQPSIDTKGITAVQLMEMDSCTRCGECVQWCPTYSASGQDPGLAPRDKILRWRDYMNKSYGLRAKLFGPKEISEEELNEFTNDLYQCTTCGICETVCESGIDTINLWEGLRANLVKRGQGPYGKQKYFFKLVSEYGNPYMEPAEKRTAWMPEDVEVKEKADIVYYGGCTAEYKQTKLAVATARVLNKLGIDFAMLGEDELCCGSPLLRTGQSELENIARDCTIKNVENIKAKGASKVLYACAGCYRTSIVDWPKLYGKPLPFEIVHITEFLADLIKQGKIKWEKSINKTVTYHDPCHMGRHVGTYDAPRYVLENIPGIKLIEMDRVKEYSRCCGAGGGMKAGIPDLALNVGEERMEDALKTNADILTSACPFCKRNLSDARDSVDAKDMEVEDVIVLVAEALGLEVEGE